MIPFGNETVSLLHKDGAGYTLHILRGCSWRTAEARMLSGSSIVCTVETTCRIPAGQQMPGAGDLMALGEVEMAAGSEIELVREMQRLRETGHSAFRVSRVKNNAIGAPMPHYSATGE